MSEMVCRQEGRMENTHDIHFGATKVQCPPSVRTPADPM
jgi:hypothetical protein